MQTDKQMIQELTERGWDYHFEPDISCLSESHRAFFRGFSTPWRSTLAEVLADVRKYQEPETKAD